MIRRSKHRCRRERSEAIHQVLNGPLHRQVRGVKNIDLINLFNRSAPNSPSRHVLTNPRRKLLAILELHRFTVGDELDLRKFLDELRAWKIPRLGQKHRTSDYGACETTAANFVDT